MTSFTPFNRHPASQQRNLPPPPQSAVTPLPSLAEFMAGFRRHRYGFLPCSAFEPDFGRHRYQQQVLPLYARRFYSFFMCTHHIRQYTTPYHSRARVACSFLHVSSPVANRLSGCQPKFPSSAAAALMNFRGTLARRFACTSRAPPMQPLQAEAGGEDVVQMRHQAYQMLEVQRRRTPH